MNMNALFSAVMALDLDAIKVKLMHVASGEGWSVEHTNAVEKEYRRFLCLMKLYPEEDTAPLVDVDTFWHYHILDTMKYAADCEQVFGYFLHHYPYVGLRGDNDDQFRIDSGDRMRTLYETTFSEAYPAVFGGHEAQAPAVCADFGIGLQAHAMSAWCASPGIKNAAGKAPANDAVAWCASPGIKNATGKAAANDAVAWCASPGIRNAAGKDIVAWCASPGVRAAAAKSAVAWCASPGTTATRAAATAWCASPGTRNAVCAA
jgi:hypothetical protein